MHSKENINQNFSLVDTFHLHINQSIFNIPNHPPQPPAEGRIENYEIKVHLSQI
jgi:hypothetical protein